MVQSFSYKSNHIIYCFGAKFLIFVVVQFSNAAVNMSLHASITNVNISRPARLVCVCHWPATATYVIGHDSCVSHIGSGPLPGSCARIELQHLTVARHAISFL